MSVNLSPLGGAGWQFLDNSGNVLSGGLLYTYSAGTTTPLTTYQDATGTTANANPVVLDAAGRVSGEVWLTAGLNYKFVLKTSTGTTLWTADNISGGTDAAASVLAQLAASGGSSLIGFLQSGTGAVATTVQSKLRETVSIPDFSTLAQAVTARSSGGVAVPTQTAYAYGTLQPGFIHVNEVDGATIGTNEILSNGTFTGSATGWVLTNFTYSSNAIAHTAGTVGTASQSIVVQPFRTYLASITITTTTFGAVDFVINGTGYLEGGYQYDVGTTTNTYALLIPDTGSVTFQVSTDTAWAGSIDTVSLIEVSADWQPSEIWAASDDTQLRIPSGIKFGRYNAGNIAIGDKQTMALTQNAGVWNVAMGARALATNQTGFENTAVGSFALQYASSSRNSAFGYSALKYLTTGQMNTGLGFKSYAATAGGSRNTGAGFHTGLGNVSGSDNTAVGYQSLYSAKTASNNTVVGSQAGMAHTGGSNTLVGALAGYLNSDVNITYSYTGTTSIGAETKVYGNNGVALGYLARVGADGAAVSGSVAIGKDALATTDESVAVGYVASAGTGFRGVAVGATAASTSSDRGTAVGWAAKAQGTYATAIGGSAGTKMSGNENTFLGTSAGNITTNSYTNCTLLGFGTDVTANNQVQLGDSRTTTYAYGAVQNRSDARDKADVRDTTLGLSFINALRPVDFKWDYRDSYRELDADGNVIELPKDGSRKRNRFHHGLIAQEVKATCDAAGVDFGGFQNHSINGGGDVLSIGYEELIAPLIKAVQELAARVTALESK